MKVVKKFIHALLSISGFIPEHMTWARSIFMLGSVLFSAFLLPTYSNINYAMGYFAFTTLVYIGFIYLVLPQNGLRLKLIEKYGEEEAYLYYEGFLAFAFFHNGAGLSYINQCSAGTGTWGDIPHVVVVLVAFVLFVLGMGIKLWAASVVGIPIYYWKDMFLGRKIDDFVVTGPYKYFKNPMYGIGQVQIYAIAIYYNSTYGLIFGAINQLLVFLFYFTVEKQFIYRTYVAPTKQEEI